MNIFNRFSLRTRILFVIGFIISMISGSSYYALEQMAGSYTQRLYSGMSLRAENLDNAIQAQFFERYGDIQAFAVNPNVKKLDEKAISPDLDSYVSLYVIYDLVLVVDKDGKYVSSNTKSANGTKVDVEQLKQLNFSEAPWFKAAINEKFTESKENAYAGTFFEEFHEDPLMKVSFGAPKITLGFTTAVRDEAGKVIGVITNRSNSSWIDNEMKMVYLDMKQNGYDTAAVTLTDKEGLVLSDLNPGRYNSDNVAYREDTFKKQNFFEAHQEAGPLAKEGKSGAISSLHKEENIVDVVGFRTMEGSKWIPEIGWRVFVHESEEEGLAPVKAAETVFYWTLGIGMLISMFVGTWFGISLSRRITLMTETLGKNSSELSEASAKVAVSSSKLSEGSTEQAAALQETVAAVDEISAMVDKNAEAANRSKEASALSRDAAMKGRQNVDSMIEAISEISHSNDDMSAQMDSSNAQLTEITKLISDIGNKTKVINEIVFQTKLLSFNASVEAARAGEYGKGFAVVAEEVGNLAQMSGNAAKEITTLLDESVQKVETIVNDSKTRVERLMSVSREKVKLGADTAKQCNESLEEILGQVSSVDTLVSEIAVASQEQATGIREIAKAVSQMEQVTQQNSGVAEESSAAAEQLSGQSVELKEMVQDLKRMVQGEGLIESTEPSQVIPISSAKSKVKKSWSKKEKSKPAEVPQSHEQENHQPMMKKVSGDDYIPSSDDPGFKE